LTASRGLKILVGHSYGGAVITQAASGDPDVKALVYVAACALDSNEVLSDLANAPVAHPIASRSSQTSPMARRERTSTWIRRTPAPGSPATCRDASPLTSPRRNRRPAPRPSSKLTVEPAWKTIAAYRGGLDLDALGPSRRSDRLEGAAMRQALLAALEANEACGDPLPVQVHTGFGDSDLFLPRDQPRTHPMPRDPELYLLAATWWRDALAAMGPEALPAAAAEDAARMILRENALALYRLSASGRCGVSRTDTRCERMGHFAAEPAGHDGRNLARM
jgi:pimeloyl-ACP methyl ester carboxylesterase